MQSRRYTSVGMNPIVVKNNAIVTWHLDDEECDSELHGDDPFGLHRVGPHAVNHKVGLHELVILPYKLLEHGAQHQVDGSATVVYGIMLMAALPSTSVLEIGSILWAS
jgi:hypothetical protein